MKYKILDLQVFLNDVFSGAQQKQYSTMHAKWQRTPDREAGLFLYLYLYLYLYSKWRRTSDR